MEFLEKTQNIAQTIPRMIAQNTKTLSSAPRSRFTSPTPFPGHGRPGNEDQNDGPAKPAA